MTKKLLLPADINTRANNSSIDQAVILSARPIFNSLLVEDAAHLRFDVMRRFFGVASGDFGLCLV